MSSSSVCGRGCRPVCAEVCFEVEVDWLSIEATWCKACASRSPKRFAWAACASRLAWGRFAPSEASRASVGGPERDALRGCRRSGGEKEELSRAALRELHVPVRRGGEQEREDQVHRDVGRVPGRAPHAHQVPEKQRV